MICRLLLIVRCPAHEHFYERDEYVHDHIFEDIFKSGRHLCRHLLDIILFVAKSAADIFLRSFNYLRKWLGVWAP
jgi:hypothetical protein